MKKCIGGLTSLGVSFSRTFTKLAGGACVILLIAGAYVSSASATTFSTRLQARAHPYSHTRAQLASDGISTYQLSGSHSLPEGGTSYDYDLPDGSVFSILVPPAGFDPVQATPAVRAAYSIPSPPPQGELNAYATWATDWFQLASAQFPVPPFITNSDLVRHGINTDIWSGWIAKGGQNAFDSVDAYWTHPHVNTSYCAQPNSVSFWSGIGGTSASDSLGQDGTETDVYAGGAYFHYAWIQIVNPSNQNVYYDQLGSGTYPVNPGDNIEAGVTWQNDTNSNGTAHTYAGDLWNHTLGWGLLWAYHLINSADWYTGDSAEVIVERPYWSSSPHIEPLSDFTQLAVTNAYVGVGKDGNDTQHSFAWFPNGSLSAASYNMKQSSTGTLLDDTGSLWGTNGQNFQVNFDHCGALNGG